ncbi:MAG: hypothetical protein M0R77_09155 [Gammaproteobacteria bacterium]|nr:hypothetical protein [Gammaproteobacteria bacterium]
MDKTFSAAQWAALVTLRLLVGCRLLHLGILHLGLLGAGSDIITPAANTLLLKALAMLAPPPAMLAIGENAYGTVLVVLGALLVLGVYARASAIIALILMLMDTALMLPAVGATALAAALILELDALIICAVLALTLAFPTSRAFGLDGLLATRELSREAPRARARAS